MYKLNTKIYLNLLIALWLLGSACLSKKNIVPQFSRAKNYYEVKSIVADSTDAMPFLVGYRKKMDGIMNVTIGNNLQELKKEKPNSTLGNMVSDAMFLEAKKLDSTVVAAVANYGGIRIPAIAKGPITLGKIYELMPFDNALCTVNLNGALVDTLCQYIAKAGGWPISNFSFDMQNNTASNIVINKQALNYGSTYKFAFNDYMANGGDNCNFLVPLKKQLTGLLVRDAIIQYVKDCAAKKTNLIIEPTKRIQ